jgi:peptidoglycan/xylan/chitin deacetylase (PgdA/CDA1 family)
MVEASILLTGTLIVIGVGLIVWCSLGNPAHGRVGTVHRALILSLAVAPLVALTAWQISNSRDFQIFGEMVSRVETSVPVVALTFDDGPTPVFTEKILETLRAEGIRATFFVTGAALEENLAEARRIVADGHELGNHSYSHKRMVGRSYAFVREEIDRTDQLIRAAGYEGEIHFRPPYGKRFIVLPYYLSVTDRTTIFMDVEPESYQEVAVDSESIVQHVLEKTRPGSIILLHVMNESRGETMGAVPGIIRGLRNRGYSFVTVSELLAWTTSHSEETSRIQPHVLQAH